MFVDLHSEKFSCANAGDHAGKLCGHVVVLTDDAGRRFAGTVIESGHYGPLGAFIVLRDATGECWTFQRDHQSFGRNTAHPWRTYRGERAEGAPL